MNKVILCGRLTKDPDVRYAQGSDPMAIAKYTLAIDRKGKEKETDFINCVAFGKSGEWVEKYLHKGTKIIVSGRIQTGSYINKEGQKVNTTEVVVEDHEFAEKKDADNTANVEPKEGEFMNIPEGLEDDLPFCQPTK